MEGDIYLMEPNEKYLTSIYFTVTTITTVGYGDVDINTRMEKAFCIILMLFGVISFSYASGSLASILQSYDIQSATYKEQLSILNKIFKQYKLPLSLYANLKQSLTFQANNDIEDIHRFSSQLPHKLKVELSVYLFRGLYKKIHFLQNKSSSFLAWMCPLFKPIVFVEQQYIYFEGDDVGCIYFLKRGSSSYVLPKHNNQRYIDISLGSTFGIVDIIASCYKNALIDVENWITRKDLMQRQNTILATNYCEIMTISTQELYRVQLEFQEYYDAMFKEQTEFLEKLLILKLGVIQICNCEEMGNNTYKIPSYTSDLLAQTEIEVIKKDFDIKDCDSQFDREDSQ